MIRVKLRHNLPLQHNFELCAAPFGGRFLGAGLQREPQSVVPEEHRAWEIQSNVLAHLLQ